MRQDTHQKSIRGRAGASAAAAIAIAITIIVSALGLVVYSVNYSDMEPELYEASYEAHESGVSEESAETSGDAPAARTDDVPTARTDDVPVSPQKPSDGKPVFTGDPRTFITDMVYSPDLVIVKKAKSFEGIVPDRYGDAGLLLIPGVGVNVCLNKGSETDDAYNQQIVDFEDSAGLINWGGNDLIGDHSDQGFSAIRRCVPGVTKAYIAQADESYEEYTCVKLMDGTNDEHHLIGSDGHDYMNTLSDEYDLAMYTCLESWRHIEIVLWKRVE